MYNTRSKKVIIWERDTVKVFDNANGTFSVIDNGKRLDVLDEHGALMVAWEIYAGRLAAEIERLRAELE